MEVNIDQLAAHLKKLREEQGEDAYRASLTGFAKNLLAQGETAPFIEKLLERLEDSLDLEPLKKEAETLRVQREKAQQAAKDVANAPDFNQAMIGAMKQQMPNLKTQAQFDLVMRVFEAVQLYLNASFGGDDQGAAHARAALNQGLDLAPKLGVMAEEAAKSPEIPVNPAYTEEPRQFTEEASYEQLMKELDGIGSAEQLQQWYGAHKEEMDRIVSQGLRNKLFDRIRDRKKELAN